MTTTIRRSFFRESNTGPATTPARSCRRFWPLASSQHFTGKDVITAIILGYDLSIAFLEGVTGPGMEKSGWNGDTRGAYIMPLVIGWMLGMTEEQMESAVGIAGSCHAVFGILDTPAEEYTMTKNIRFPMMSYAAIMAASWRKRGSPALRA